MPDGIPLPRGSKRGTAHDDHHHEDELITDRFRIHIGPNMIKAILALALLIAVIMGDSINPSQFF